MRLIEFIAAILAIIGAIYLVSYQWNKQSDDIADIKADIQIIDSTLHDTKIKVQVIDRYLHEKLGICHVQ